jgi:hypothetical protein
MPKYGNAFGSMQGRMVVYGCGSSDFLHASKLWLTAVRTGVSAPMGSGRVKGREGSALP